MFYLRKKLHVCVYVYMYVYILKYLNHFKEFLYFFYFVL